MTKRNQDGLVTLLICSDLGLSREINSRHHPYTVPEWNNLVDLIIRSPLKTPASLLRADSKELEEDLHLHGDELDRMQFLLKRGVSLALELEQLESRGVYVTTRADENYPLILKKVLKKQCPPVLFYCGNLNLVHGQSVAIVGSGDKDEAGILFTENLARQCIKEGFTIVSGGAGEIASLAENVAIFDEGQAISIVSHGLNRKIKEKSIRNAILQNRLLVLSTVHPEARFTECRARNPHEMIYALSTYAVVVSSEIDKGETWTGAIKNMKDKGVPLFVRDGENVPRGNRKLMELGGRPIDPKILGHDKISIKAWLVEKALTKEKN